MVKDRRGKRQITKRRKWTRKLKIKPRVTGKWKMDYLGHLPSQIETKRKEKGEKLTKIAYKTGISASILPVSFPLKMQIVVAKGWEERTKQ